MRAGYPSRAADGRGDVMPTKVAWPPMGARVPYNSPMVLREARALGAQVEPARLEAA